MPTLWQNALIMAMDEDHSSVPFRGDLLIDGDRIRLVRDAAAEPVLEASADDIPRATEIVDATGLLLCPGLINAHTHSWEMLFRGTSERLPLELWSFVSYPPLGVAPVPDRLVYLRTMLAGIESLLGGTTALLDDVGELPEQSPESLRQVMDAYGDIGIRASCSGFAADIPLVDRLPYADSVFSAEVLQGSRAAQRPTADVITDFLAFSADAIEYAERFEGRVRYVVAPSAPHRVTDELLVAAHEFSRQHGLVLHLHLLETRLQAVLAQQRWGKTAVAHLDELGVLTDNVTVAHGVWLTAEDRELLAASGATLVHNPLSNQKLGSGRLDWRGMHDAGVRLAIGTDGASSSDSLRMLDAVTAAALLHTTADPDYSRWPSQDEVLRAALLGGAAAVGQRGELGRLVAGAKADLVVFDLARSTAFTPLHDAARQLVFSENGSSIAQVWVDGRLVVEDGVCTLVDQAALLEEFRREAAAYLEGHADRIAASAEHVPAVAAAYTTAWKDDLLCDSTTSASSTPT